MFFVISSAFRCFFGVGIQILIEVAAIIIFKFCLVESSLFSFFSLPYNSPSLLFIWVLKSKSLLVFSLNIVNSYFQLNSSPLTSRYQGTVFFHQLSLIQSLKFYYLPISFILLQFFFVQIFYFNHGIPNYTHYNYTQ